MVDNKIDITQFNIKPNTDTSNQTPMNLPNGEDINETPNTLHLKPNNSQQPQQSQEQPNELNWKLHDPKAIQQEKIDNSKILDMDNIKPKNETEVKSNQPTPLDLITDGNTPDLKTALYQASNSFNETREGISYSNWAKTVKRLLDYVANYKNPYIPSVEQYRALLTTSKYTLVDASPGTGKTATLMYKIFLDGQILGKGNSSQLAVTYTNAASKSMKRSYEELSTKFNKYTTVNFNTIHAFAKDIEVQESNSEILTEHGLERIDFSQVSYEEMEMGMCDPESLPVKKITNESILQETITELNLTDKYGFLTAELDGWLSIIVEKMIKTQDKLMELEEFNELGNIHINELLKILSVSRRKRKAEGVINYLDMLLNFYERIKNITSLEELKDKPILQGKLYIDYLYIDEFQDISPIQWAIVTELVRLNPQCKLYCIGDADQSIYSFRGADSKYLVDYKQEIKMMLLQNQIRNKYPEKMINVSSVYSEYKNIEDNANDNYEIYQNTFGSVKTPEGRKLLYNKLIKDTLNSQDINIDNDIFNEIDEQINTNLSVIFFTINRRSGDNIVKFASSFIKTNTSRYNKEMQSLNHFDTEIDIISLQNCKIEKITPEEIIVQKLSAIKNERLLEFGVPNLSDIAIIYREHLQSIPLKIKLISHGIPVSLNSDQFPNTFYETRDLLGIWDMIHQPSNPSLVERYLYKCIPSINKERAKFIANKMRQDNTVFSKYINDPNPNSKINIELNKLRSIHALFKSNQAKKAIQVTANLYFDSYLTYFKSAKARLEITLQYLNSFATGNHFDLLTNKNKFDQILSVHKRNNHGVQFYTMHSSKGLEFNDVIILPIGNTTTPKTHILNKMTSDHHRNLYTEEERRLNFVAVTRAKRNLTIFIENEEDKFPEELLKSQRLLNLKTKNTLSEPLDPDLPIDPDIFLPISEELIEF